MFYTVRVQLEFEGDNGKPKKKKETYLVKAETVTDAEAIIHDKFAGYPMGYEVKSVSESRVIDVYSAD